jgi:hypothetical protein
MNKLNELSNEAREAINNAKNRYNQHLELVMFYQELEEVV